MHDRIDENSLSDTDATSVEIAKEGFFANSDNFNTYELYWDVDKLGETTENDLTKLNNLLTDHKSIKRLYLCHNKLGTSDKLVNALIKLLEINTQLESVDLRFNRITDKALENFLQSKALQARLKEMYFDLSANLITEEGLKKAVPFLSPTTIRHMTYGNLIMDSDFVLECRKNGLEEIKKQEKETDEKTPVVHLTRVGLFNTSSSSAQSPRSSSYERPSLLSDHIKPPK